jgi:hypothetical protein
MMIVIGTTSDEESEDCEESKDRIKDSIVM